MPARMVTTLSPPPGRHTGSVGEGVVEGVDELEAVQVGVILPVGVADIVVDGDGVVDCDGVPEALPELVLEGVLDGETELVGV